MDTTAATSLLDDQLREDLSNLNSFDETRLVALVDLILSFLLDPQGTDFTSGLGSYAETHRVNSAILKGVVRSLIVFLQGAMKDGWTSAELELRCSVLGLSPEATTQIIECWKQKAPRMASSLLSRTLKANQLIDLDWNFGVTAASDDCDQVGKTFLQLKFTIDAGEDGPKDIFMELSLDQFYQFLAQMENCKSYLDFLTSN